MNEALEFALKALNALQSLPQLVQAGSAAWELIQNTKERLDAMVAASRGPTQAEKEAQNALIEQLRAELHQGEDQQGTGA